MKKKFSPILGAVGSALILSAVMGTVKNAYSSDSTTDLSKVKNDVWKVQGQPTTNINQTFSCHSNCHSSCHSSCGRKGW